jgi:hypothetical protein
MIEEAMNADPAEPLGQPVDPAMSTKRTKRLSSIGV